MQQSTKSLGYPLVTTKKAAKSVFITEDRTHMKDLPLVDESNS
jgi:hypothetical protein